MNTLQRVDNGINTGASTPRLHRIHTGAGRQAARSRRRPARQADFPAGRGRVAVLTALIAVVAAAAYLPRLRAQSQPAAASTGMPQQAFFAYWSLADGFTSSIVLNNSTDQPLIVRPTLYDPSGNALPVAAVQVPGRQNVRANIADWISASGGSPNLMQAGSLVLDYIAPEAGSIGAQVTVKNGNSGVSFDVPDEMPMSFASSKLEGMWWRPTSGSAYDLVVSNMSAAPLTATVNFGASSGGGMQLALSPHESRVIDLDSGVDGLKPGFGFDKFGGISITHDGEPGSVQAEGLLSDPARRFSSHFPFSDPAMGMSNQLAAAHVFVGAADAPGLPKGLNFTTIGLFRNVSPQPVTLAPSISFRDAGSSGNERTVKLASRQIAAGSVTSIDAGEELASAGVRGPINGAAFSATYTGAHGAVIGYLTAFDPSMGHWFNPPVKDPAVMMNRFGGSYPWDISGDQQSVVHVMNANPDPTRFIIQIDYPGGSYALPIQSLDPAQEADIDIRGLRDNQVPDSIGRLLPRTLNQGQVNWFEHGPGPLTGRLEIFSPSSGVSASYSCAPGCCPPSSSCEMSVPNYTGRLGDSASVQLLETDFNNCGYSLGPFDITSGATWTSSNPTAVSVTSPGHMSLVAPGYATISASFRQVEYDDECIMHVFDNVPCTCMMASVSVALQKSDGSALPAPFRVGISATTLAGQTHDRTQHMRAVVSPAAEASNINITATGSGSNPGQVTISNKSANSSTGIVTFDIVGTVMSHDRGDVTLKAKDGGSAMATAAVSVVVPGSIAEPHDTSGQGVVVENRALNSGTRPALTDVPVTQAALDTLYGIFLDVSLNDQLGDPLGDVYTGAEVSEFITSDNRFHSLNSPVTSSGTYVDYVGQIVRGQVVSLPNTQVADWPSAQPLPLTASLTGTQTQNIIVKVDGFQLVTGIVNRTVTVLLPANVTVNWP